MRLTQTGLKLITLESVDSTNEEAFRHHEAGEAAPFFIMADIQTHGRGRAGRSWQSPKGNLYLSCCLKDPSPAQALTQLGFVAGLALVKSLKNLALETNFTLKWPNDVLEGNAKIAGILLETRKQGDNNIVVVGWGVNIKSCPRDLPYPATALKRNHPQLDRDMLLHQILRNFPLWFEEWNAGKNFSAIRTEWLKNTMAKGTMISVKSNAQQRIEGEFESIDEDGALLMATSSGLQRILAGDVTPRTGVA